MSFRSRVLLGVVAVALTVPVFSQAQNAPPMRIRGKIESSDAQTISVITRDGMHQTFALTDTTRISTVKALKLSDIKKGSYIGVAGKPVADGKIEALSVQVFPEDARGRAEGHYDYDLLPGSTMTNATVSAMVSGKTGRDLELTYKDGTTKVIVPKKAPVVTFPLASAKELKPGLAVFLAATSAADGKLTATRVIVEKDGVKPPL